MGLIVRLIPHLQRVPVWPLRAISPEVGEEGSSGRAGVGAFGSNMGNILLLLGNCGIMPLLEHGPGSRPCPPF